MLGSNLMGAKEWDEIPLANALLPANISKSKETDLIVTTLIATVAFAAGITIALTLSGFAVLSHLGTMTDHPILLKRQLALAFVCTTYAMIAMLLAFITGTYAVYPKTSNRSLLLSLSQASKIYSL
ncbi:hypothetical protein TEA_016579 [Camellia sinensis var. sinensis]|uniref:PGG domain-containing protein n=1 Tax=Camellia sinensis var. sinensis TaxID=542762 RepID=A0A4V3WJT7_CAMSN|nr:hypothetical protein TEA_016579 [Camellia sinensis var. sinensis]